MPNAILAEHAGNPRNIGDLDGATVIGRAGTPGEGPFMLMGLWASDQRIERARFDTYGCPNARACGSWVTEWVRGKTFATASMLEPADLETVMGGLPLGKEHCASLAVTSLRHGIELARGADGS